MSRGFGVREQAALLTPPGIPHYPPLCKALGSFPLQVHCPPPVGRVTISPAESISGAGPVADSDFHCECGCWVGGVG